MAGLVPAIHVLLRDDVEKIIPIRIVGDNLSNFPSSRPVFDIVFALNGLLNGFILFEIDESLQAVPLRKAFYRSGSVFKHAADDVVRNANINYAVWLVGQKIDVAT